MINAEDLTDNEFLRQYEIKVGEQLMKIEYASQDRKIFLTKLEIPEDIHTQELEEEFLTIVLQHIGKNVNVSTCFSPNPICDTSLQSCVSTLVDLIGQPTTHSSFSIPVPIPNPCNIADILGDTHHHPP